jgi:hypothetical protein
LQAALAWAGQQGGALGEVKEYISRAVGTPIKDLQYEVPEYMKEMVGKHVDIKDSLPPYTCEWSRVVRSAERGWLAGLAL